MQVSTSSTISQAFAGFRARGGGATTSWQVRLGDRGSTSGTDQAQVSAAGFAALMRDGAQPPELTDDQAAQLGSLIQQQDPDAFSQLDTDQDGSLTASELAAAKPPEPPPEPSDDQAARLGALIQQQDPDAFQTLDADGDGTLTAAELKTATQDRRGPPPPPAGGAGAAGGQSSGQQDLLANLLNELLRQSGRSGKAA